MSFHPFLVAVGALASISISVSQTASAAAHQDVTPYEALKSRLVLTPGQTYLSFMQKQVKPALDSYEEVIQNDPATQSKNYAKLQTDLIAQGAGAAVRIDSRNYIFNIGYLDGSDPTNDVKSGRSYGVGPTNLESDPSDVAYLSELEAYLQSEPDAIGDFVKSLMLVLTDCDSSGWAGLSTNGQIVATDFLAIYTAENDRHIMVNLKPNAHPWEIDLAAATFVSIFDTATGLIMQNGALVKGSIKQWWAKGTQGSGIGETRKDRIALQRLISSYESSANSVAEISKAIGTSADADVIQTVLEYLNSPDAPEVLSNGGGRQLPELMQEFLLKVRADAGAIAAH